jgi:hypothetical protein
LPNSSGSFAMYAALAAVTNLIGIADETRKEHRRRVLGE